MKIKLLATILILSAGLLVLEGCSDTEEPQDDCNVSFKDDLAPLTSTSCVGYCHTTWDHFSNFQNIKVVADSGILWDKLVVSRTMPQYPGYITEEQRDLFAQWIECGAPNN